MVALRVMLVDDAALVREGFARLLRESWLYFYGLGVVLELIVLALIVRYAWTWPRTAPSATMTANRVHDTPSARPA